MTPIQAKSASAQNDKFIVTPTGLQVIGSPTFDEWMAYGQTLWAMRSAIQWAIADWIQYGEHHFGDKYAQAIDTTKQSYQTLANYVWVATRFPVSRRRGNLSFSHHEAVAAIPDPAKRDELLTQATHEHLDRDAVRELAKPFKPARPPKVTPRPPEIIEMPIVPQQGDLIFGTVYTHHVGLGVVTFKVTDTALMTALRNAPPGTPASISLQRYEPTEDARQSVRYERRVDTRLVTKVGA